MTILKYANKDSEAKVRRLTENHTCDRKKMLHQHELIVSDHYRKVRSFQEQAKEAEKSTLTIEDCLEIVFSRRKSLDKVVRACYAAFDQYFEKPFQDFLRDLCKTLTEHWHQLCRMFSNFFFCSR